MYVHIKPIGVQGLHAVCVWFIRTNVRHAHDWLSLLQSMAEESSDPSVAAAAAAAVVGHDQVRWSCRGRGRDLAPCTVRIRRRPAENYR